MKSVIMSTLVQAAKECRPVCFYWSKQGKKVVINKYVMGVSITIPRKAFVKGAK